MAAPTGCNNRRDETFKGVQSSSIEDLNQGGRRIMAKTAIISVDGHVKASRAGYRDYIQKAFLEAYDESVKAAEEAGMPDAGNLNPEYGFDAQWDSKARWKTLEGQGGFRVMIGYRRYVREPSRCTYSSGCWYSPCSRGPARLRVRVSPPELSIRSLVRGGRSSTSPSKSPLSRARRARSVSSCHHRHDQARLRSSLSVH